MSDNVVAVVIAVYVTGALASWFLAAGMDFAYFEGKYPSLRCAARTRENISEAITRGFICGVIWPLGLPMMLCSTGFAYYGVWRVREDRVGKS